VDISESCPFLNPGFLEQGLAHSRNSGDDG
jgi:hypothetical protein